ncbi:ras and Rab interactor-like protein isoform X2 [Perognathus longimembris pacificus]|uniref:ras and Rab interactor-like protein isoform X2 n=1 Tax=Perognathus longimembris pacificus TaxID=214514 RepID=UPI00201916AE|nr:ras and Rab interactor-like protein isoform X2 [Perognathus longimembris pacificus]
MAESVGPAGGQGPTRGQRLFPLQTNGAGETSRPLGPPASLLRLQRGRGVWQVPDLDAQRAKDLVQLWPPGSFLVVGRDPSQILVLRTGPLPGEVNTYQIQKFPGGVSLDSSNICMPDLPHLLAFLSASRDILPRTLLLPSAALGPGDKHPDALLVGGVQRDMSRRTMYVVNQLYLETHGAWEMEKAPQESETDTDTAQTQESMKPAPHRVSWVEGPLSPDVGLRGPVLAGLAEEQEEEEGSGVHKDDGDEDNDLLTAHVQALARTRSSYVAKQYRSLQARLTSVSGGPHRPGDPAIELLQDVRHLLTDLQGYLTKDPDVRAIFENRGSGVPQKEESLGSAVEAAVCRAVLAPLKPALWTRLRTLRAPELRRLRRRQMALRAGAGPPGARGVGPRAARGAGPRGAGPGRPHPRPALRNRIHARLHSLHAACAPRRKVALLLAVCGDIYAGLASAGLESPEPLGADAFLPALTEELIWSPHIGETQLDVEFLMELLDPEELRGEDGHAF